MNLLHYMLYQQYCTIYTLRLHHVLATRLFTYVKIIVLIVHKRSTVVCRQYYLHKQSFIEVQ